MLDLMRKHAYSWTTRIVLGLITVIFMFWGIGTGFFAQVHPVATVNGNRILGDEVGREADSLHRSIEQIYGARAPAVLKSINLRREALDRIIENQLIADQARHLGISVSAQALADKIASERAFQAGGQFDFRLYQEVLRENGMLPVEFEAATRTEMIQQTLRQMVDAGVQVSPDEVRHAFDLRDERIGLSYIEVPYASFTARIDPTPKQLEDYYNRYRDAFREPERVKIVYIHYQPLVLAAKLTPSDKEIQDYYQRNLKSRFTHPDQVHASHILVSVPEGAIASEKAAGRKKAEEVLKLARAAGADFGKLAAKYSDDPSTRLKGGDLGSFARGQMIKPFEDAVFKMKPGEIEIVETRFGYHVVKLDEFIPAHTDTLEEARPRIIELLRTQAGSKLARSALDEDLQAALAGQNLDELAKKRGMDAVETPYFANDEQIAGADSSRELVETAFKLDKGQVRAVPAGGAPYLIKLAERVPSRIPPFKEIEARVRETYIRVNAISDARAQAQKLLEQIKSAADFQSVAKANQLVVHSVEPFPRSTQSVPGLGEFPEVTDAAAAVPEVPGVIPRVMENGGNSYLFEVTSRALPSDEDWKSVQQSFTDEYLSERRAQAWTRYLEDLKLHADIVVHTDQLGEASSDSSSM
jgi:peptidyl-prolyl cis-trans isomerase D